MMNAIENLECKEKNMQMLIAIEKYLHLIKLEFLEHLNKYKTLYENIANNTKDHFKSFESIIIDYTEEINQNLIGFYELISKFNVISEEIPKLEELFLKVKEMRLDGMIGSDNMLEKKIEVLDIKQNSKKNLHSNIKILKNKPEMLNGNNCITNYNPDSPSNKIMSMKILTFGNNCNFPNDNVMEFNDEEENQISDLKYQNKLEKNPKSLLKINKNNNLKIQNSECDTDIPVIEEKYKNRLKIKKENIDVDNRIPKLLNKKIILDNDEK